MLRRTGAGCARSLLVQCADGLQAALDQATETGMNRCAIGHRVRETDAAPDAPGKGLVVSARRIAKSVLLQGGGWILVVAGLAAMVLPGPGLLAPFGGLAMLATQYEWADRRVTPFRNAAMRGAAESVTSWPRILLSFVGVCLLVGLGVYWGLGPAAPSWWPVVDQWWLVGGWGTGAALIGSGVAALAMLVHSYVNVRNRQPVTTPAASRGVDLRS